MCHEDGRLGKLCFSFMSSEALGQILFDFLARTMWGGTSGFGYSYRSEGSSLCVEHAFLGGVLRDPQAFPCKIINIIRLIISGPRRILACQD